MSGGKSSGPYERVTAVALGVSVGVLVGARVEVGARVWVGIGVKVGPGSAVGVLVFCRVVGSWYALTSGSEAETTSAIEAITKPRLMVRVRAKNAAIRLTFLGLRLRFPIARHKKKITIIMLSKLKLLLQNFEIMILFFHSISPYRNVSGARTYKNEKISGMGLCLVLSVFEPWLRGEPG
jgi:hypothetical protein